MFPICKLPGSCYCSAPCLGRSTSSGSCPPTESSGAFLAHSATCGRAQLAMQHGGLGLRSTAAHSCAAYFLRRGPTHCGPSRLVTRSYGQRLRCSCNVLLALRDASPPCETRFTVSRPQDSKPPRGISLHAPRLHRRTAKMTSLQISRAAGNGQPHYLAQRLDASSRALHESQSGPFAAKVFTALPTSPELRLEPASFARWAKERTYPELLRAERCRLVVLGIELGGRWSSEAAQFVWMLARSHARSAPHVLRSGATAASVSRWSALLSYAAARAVAASLLSLPLGNAANVDVAALDLSDVLPRPSLLHRWPADCPCGPRREP